MTLMTFICSISFIDIRDCEHHIALFVPFAPLSEHEFFQSPVFFFHLQLND